MSSAPAQDGAPPRTIHTIGHSNHEPDAFVDLLTSHGIELLVDVRRFPGSRRLPWTNRDALSARLERERIDYLHLESLGGRRRPMDDSPNGAWRVAQFRGYADHMRSEEFAEGMATLEREADRRRTAVMCAEAQWWRCHRRLLADALLLRGRRVLHIDSRGAVSEHLLTDFALVEDGVITYPEGGNQTSLG